MRSPLPAAHIDRLPPHSFETEQGLLGCLLMDGNRVGVTIERLPMGEDAFYDLRHRNLYAALVKMYDQQQPIDLSTVPQRLKDRLLLDAVGGLTYLASLPDASPSAANLEYYLGILIDKWTLRQIVRAGAEMVGAAYNAGADEATTVLDKAEKSILDIGRDLRTRELPTMRSLVGKAIADIEMYFDKKGALDGIATGYSDLDKMTTGLHAGEMIVIAARPSMGKSSLAMNFAENIAVNANIPVGVFSLEMTSESLVLRMLCSRARVNLRDVREGFLVERDFPKLSSSAGKLMDAPVYIDDTAGLSILQLRTRARRMAQKYGIKLLIVDYLQLLHSVTGRNENRQNEMADVSNGIKQLAKELGIPIIALSQMNRDVEREKNRKPRLSDLRETGAIEQDADLVGFLYKPNTNDEDAADNQDAIPVNLLIAKQRNGPTGDVALTFIKGYTRFESAARVDDDDVPTDGIRSAYAEQSQPREE